MSDTIMIRTLPDEGLTSFGGQAHSPEDAPSVCPRTDIPV